MLIATAGLQVRLMFFACGSGTKCGTLVDGTKKKNKVLYMHGDCLIYLVVPWRFHPSARAYYNSLLKLKGGL
ncbi:hypothetical protein F5X96DRAFT_655038 [Biscogniauxia mediterranea]|nr:hypothetical protein F5X96DRAFT_655038 [Biscogniauxia mediterranea]